MNQDQRKILWATGVAVAAVLFWVGEGHRWHYERCAAKVEAANSPLNRWIDNKPEVEPGLGMSLVVAESCGDRPGRANPYVGLIAPIVILGTCAFVTAGARPRVS